MPLEQVLYALMDAAYPVGRQDRHFYFFLRFLLLRKVSNAIIRPPKETSNASIPSIIIMISQAVISIPSLPMYSAIQKKCGLYKSGRHPPCHECFSINRFYYNLSFVAIFLNYFICITIIYTENSYPPPDSLPYISFAPMYRPPPV